MPPFLCTMPLSAPCFTSIKCCFGGIQPPSGWFYQEGSLYSPKGEVVSPQRGGFIPLKGWFYSIKKSEHATTRAGFKGGFIRNLAVVLCPDQWPVLGSAKCQNFTQPWANCHNILGGTTAWGQRAKCGKETHPSTVIQRRGDKAVKAASTDPLTPRQSSNRMCMNTGNPLLCIGRQGEGRHMAWRTPEQS